MHFPMSLNLCRTFLPLKNIISNNFLHNKYWEKSTKNCARTISYVVDSFFACNIIPLNIPQKYPYFTFSSPFCVNILFCHFCHVPRDNSSHLQKESLSGTKVHSFSWNFHLRYTDTYLHGGQNDTHYDYEIIVRVD